ncbi:hypothetical protein NP233_g1720 [Leucocoprinus birnbaumii]|uniref:Uncharacterized protein n=1 Tax=Leucocoprinus birnbaumii TaxID=56174 RepID=A0AAD5VZJ4_9AGAR|nr:hypothetical protein NP233_g1720 [Leucocoprinus birnbaumii]
MLTNGLGYSRRYSLTTALRGITIHGLQAFLQRPLFLRFRLSRMKSRSGKYYDPFPTMEPVESAIDGATFDSLLKFATEKSNNEEYDNDTCEDGHVDASDGVAPAFQDDTRPSPVATCQPGGPLSVGTSSPQDTFTLDPSPPSHLRGSKRKRWINRKLAKADRMNHTSPELRRSLVEAGRSDVVHTSLATDKLPVTSCGYQAQHLPKSKKKKSNRSGQQRPANLRQPDAANSDRRPEATTEGPDTTIPQSIPQPPLKDIDPCLARLPGLTAEVRSEYEYFPWGGISAKPVLDAHERDVAVLAGRPDDDSYVESCNHVFELMSQEAAKAGFTTKEKRHPRGRFPVVNAGVIYGKGTTEPVNLKLGRHRDMTWRLLQNKDVQQVMKFGNTGLGVWNPKLYEYFKAYGDKLFSHPGYSSSLRRITPDGVFTRVAFNFGPNAVLDRHRDPMNISFGWCSVQSYGPFDPEKGGHIVLEQAKLAIELPPGSLILIPSATMIHWNVPIQKGEQRASITQFCTAGIFRFVDNGFRTEEQLLEHSETEYLAMLAAKSFRWLFGLSMYKTLDELVEY